MMRLHPLRTVLVLAAVLLGAGPALAQSGSFVIPSFRTGGGSDFAYWDFFKNPAGSSVNFNYDNPPALLSGSLGMDDAGNVTTARGDRTNLRQTGTNTCFVTSTGALYSFAARTAFEVPYTPPAALTGEVTNVIFQTQSGGAGLDLENIRIVYEKVVPGGTQTTEVAAILRGLDNPQTGAFSERRISAFQWDLTGLGIRNFKIKFAGETSLALWQAQLDVVVDAPFDPELGYLLFTRSRPSTRYGRPGRVDKNLPFGKDGRFFFPGDELDLYAEPELDWEPVGLIYEGVFTEGYELPIVFPNGDASVTAVFAPLTYDEWRNKMFYHSNSILGSPADDLNDAVSGPNVDHDSDGMNNLNEYASGGDPYTPDVSTLFSSVSVEGVAYPTVQYRTNGAPPEYADVTLRVQVSTDLIHWMDNETTPGVVVSEETASARQMDGTMLVTARINQPLGGLPRFFIRVAAVANNP